MIKSINKDTSITAGQFIPAGVRDVSHDLEAILRAYYEWAESDGEFLKESRVLAEAFSWKTAPDDYLPYFKSTLLRLFPNTNKAILRHLLKFSKLFYQSRGTPESYEFLFRAIWGADVKLSFPSDNILKTSDGVWEVRDLLKIDTSIIKSSLKGKTLVGTKSKSRALVSDIKSVQGDITELVLESLSSDFLTDENVTIYDTNLLTGKIGKARVVPSLGAYDIINPGKGYRADAVISLQDNYDADGEGFKANIFAVNSSEGTVVSLTILDPGKNYLYRLPRLNLTDSFLFDSSLPKDDRQIAEIELKFVGNYKEPGSYRKLKSALSDNFKLHDGDYYQDYSYVLETKLEREIIIKPVMELLHPAGTKMFYKRMFNEFAENYVDFYAKTSANNGIFQFKPSTVVTYSNNFNYNAPESIYEK